MVTKRHLYFRTFLIAALAAGSVGAAGLHEQQNLSQLVPPTDQLGECYAQVFVPPAFEKSMVQEIVKEPSERIEKIPAKYELEEQTVLVKEPTERIEVIPAVYDWVEEKVLIQPASERLEVVPAVYESRTERVVVTPAHTVWKKGSGPFQRLDHATGDIVCLVEVPAVYRTFARRTLKQPATTRTLQIPPQYKTVKKNVLITPATTRSVMLPGEYKTVKVNKLVEPARFNRVSIPAQYREVQKQVKVKNGRLEWQPVLCETNVTPDIIRSIQRALTKADYNPGPADGVLGSQTVTAIEAYQKNKGLPVGSLTLQTIKSLGVSVGTHGAPDSQRDSMHRLKTQHASPVAQATHRSRHQ